MYLAQKWVVAAFCNMSFCMFATPLKRDCSHVYFVANGTPASLLIVQITNEVVMFKSD